MTIGPSQCSKCLHFTAERTCPAFPEGIPLDIMTWRVDHTKPVDGDHGIRFDPTPEWVAYLTRIGLLPHP